MKTRIETARPIGDRREALTVEIGANDFGENVVITKTVQPLSIFSAPKISDDLKALRLGHQAPEKGPVSVELAIHLDAETARALSFALAELAKVLRRQEC